MQDIFDQIDVAEPQKTEDIFDQVSSPSIPTRPSVLKIAAKQIKEHPFVELGTGALRVLDIARWPYRRFIEHPVSTIVTSLQKPKGKIPLSVAKEAGKVFLPKRIPRKDVTGYEKIWDNYWQAILPNTKTPAWYKAIGSFGTAMGVEPLAIRGAVKGAELAATRPATVKEMQTLRKIFKPFKDTLEKSGVKASNLHKNGNVIRLSDKSELVINDKISAVLRGDKIRVPRWAKIPEKYDVSVAETVTKQLPTIKGPQVTPRAPVSPVTPIVPPVKPPTKVDVFDQVAKPTIAPEVVKPKDVFDVVEKGKVEIKPLPTEMPPTKTMPKPEIVQPGATVGQIPPTRTQEIGQKAVEEPDVTFVKSILQEPIEKIGPQIAEQKGELRIAGEQKEASELEQAYAKQKDIWIGNKDVRTVLEIPAEKKNLQKAIKAAANTKDYGDLAKGYDMAIQLHIDSKRNLQQVSELYPKLSPEQKKLIDLSRNLSPEVQRLADEITKSYEQIGLEALEADVIKNVLDNYAARIWDIEGKGGAETLRKFGTTTRHAKQRVFDTIAEGWSKGFNLKVKGATSNLAILKEEIVKTIEDKKFVKALKKIKDIDGNPLLTTKHLSGYIKVEHPNFKTWKWVGKAEPGEVYGRNSFVDDEGNLFERQELYAPRKQANNLNNILGISKIKGTLGGFTDFATKYNAVLKAWILQTSLFHHMAFGRSYYLGTNRKTFKEMQPIDAVNDGNRMIDEMSPIIVQGVRNGLTLGRKQDWSEDLLKEKTAIGLLLDQWGVSRVVKDKILDLRQGQADFLFGVVGAGLKAKAYAIEYRNQTRKYPNENADVVAKRVANLINDDFGGLHLQRMGRNPTTQHIFRLLALAPDWTESNIRTMVKSFKGGKEGKMYRHFWAGILAKGLGATILANLAMAAFDEDDVDGQGVLERFYRNYKRAFAEGKYRWLDVDITPIYKAFGGTSDERYYFSILGHFKDPLKLSVRNDRAKKNQMISTFKLGNTRAMKHKASVIGGMFLDYTTGTDYAERRFTTLKELAGVDYEKGEYKTTRKGKYEKGDPKWGKLKGQTVTWDYAQGGSVESEQLPSFILNQAKGAQPVQVQQLMGYWAGELGGFIALGNSLGLGVSKTYSSLSDKMNAIKEGAMRINKGESVNSVSKEIAKKLHEKPSREQILSLRKDILQHQARKDNPDMGRLMDAFGDDKKEEILRGMRKKYDAKKMRELEREILHMKAASPAVIRKSRK